MRFLLAIVLACVALGHARAQDLVALEQAVFRAAAERVAPCVVQIETIGGAERVGKLLFGTGPTTGVIVGAEGYVVSSAFSFANRPASILVRLADGTRRAARLVATDHSRMLVLLKIDPPGPLPVAQVVPEREMRVGQWTIAVGRAFDADRTNIAVGILSAVGRIWQKAIQTDAAVSPNNYGGALVDVRGRLLGILVPLSPETDSQVAGFAWYDSGIGFAVPAEHIMKILPRLQRGEDLRPGLAGISFRARGLQSEEPVLATCRARSPADKAGLRPGDRIVEIDGRKIERAAHVKEAISRRYAGDKIRVIALRGENRVEALVELADKLLPYQQPSLGALPRRAAALAAERGVALRWIIPGSPADKAGLRPGDRLLALAGKPIADRDELVEQLSALDIGQEVSLEFSRDEKRQTVKVTLASPSEELPPKELPPARTPADAGKPEPGTGVVAVRPGELPHEVWACVPDNYAPSVGHGLVIWLQGSNAVDPKELLSRWAPHCLRQELIFVVPKPASGTRWSAADAPLVRKLVEEMQSSYTIDPARVVVVGQEGGGTLAYQAAFEQRELIRALIAVDAPLLIRPPENEPLQSLSFLLLKAGNALLRPMVTQTAATLQALKFPVTTKDLPAGGLSDPAELAEIARWVDMLDRI